MRKELVYGIALFLASTTIIISSENIRADSESYQTSGEIGFTPGKEITPPVNPGPNNPGSAVTPIWPDGKTPSPGTPGPLSIDYVSSFDFGINNISTQDRTYYAKSQRYINSNLETPNYIQVTDNRGTTAGWTLKVIEKAQFRQENVSAKHRVLEGAMISLKNPEAVSANEDAAPKIQEINNLVPGKETVVATAEKGAGVGTWTIRWGSKLVKQNALNKEGNVVKENFNTDVQLYVPGKTIKDAASYTTQLKWILSELPQNS
ncbi:WxL domain-containing protein [Lactococcus garvieae]|uniref:WxL domain-containing protein n=1 Tax=Lactococcus garvieae TaxID=1363 RepID=UPI0018D7CE6A|nr:WxL domain-containing protein [Lactococcus garvieae]QPS72043.1 WxL domain-containing protein [Lactococcus garvieae]